MTRTGWAVLLLFVAIGGGFIALATFKHVAEKLPASVPTVGGPLRMPVAGVAPASLVDSFADPRGGGKRAHRALDIPAPAGTPVVAASAGIVEKLFDSDAGGHTVYIRADAGRTVHYYAHLDRYAAGLAEGRAVRAGDAIGFVGSSGNADPAAPHLHFEVKQVTPAMRWYEGRPVDPYPLLGGR